MAKFNFRLESLLNIKIQKEDLKKMELAVELKKMEIEKRKLEILIRKNKNQINIYIESINEGVSVEKVRNYHNYLDRLNKNIEEQNENINIIGKNVDKIRGELINKSQERRILEKLKEKEFQIHKEGVLKKEQEQNDELISYRQNRALAVMGQ